jgi:hypothetical protein
VYIGTHIKKSRDAAKLNGSPIAAKRSRRERGKRGTKVKKDAKHTRTNLIGWLFMAHRHTHTPVV